MTLSLPFYEDDPCCANPCNPTTNCRGYLKAYSRIGDICDLNAYAEANCTFTENEGRDTEHIGLAASEPQGSNHDDVWGADRHGIARIEDVVPAQGGAVQEQAGVQQPLNAADQATFGLPEISLVDVLAKSMAPLVATNPALAATFEAMKTDADMVTANEQFNAMLKNSVMGPPTSAEMIFLKPMVAGIMAAQLSESSKDTVELFSLGTSTSDSAALNYKGQRTMTEKSSNTFPAFLAGGCAQIIPEDVEKAAHAVGDAIIPNAYAADCPGPGNSNACKIGTPTCDIPAHVCSWNGSAFACWRGECGDGCVGTKDCDPLAEEKMGVANDGCTDSNKHCDSHCKCVPNLVGPACGNHVKDSNEDCDPSDPDPADQTCPAGFTCVGCACNPSGGGGVLPQPNVRLPMAPQWKGHREITIVALKQKNAQNTCNYNAKVDLPTEQCDSAGLRDNTPPLTGTVRDYEREQCRLSGWLPGAGRVFAGCNLYDCTCQDGPQACVDNPSAACKRDADCPADNICDFECKCRPQLPPPPTPPRCAQTDPCRSDADCTTAGTYCRADCTCTPVPPAGSCTTDPAAVCDGSSSKPCLTGQYCAFDCKCYNQDQQPPATGGGATTPGDQNTATLLSQPEDGCVGTCLTFSSDAMKERITNLNKQYCLDVTGLPGDCICEVEQKMEWTCKVSGAAISKTAAASQPSLSASVAPGNPDYLLRPYMIAQTSGSMPIDPGTWTYQGFEPVKAAFRIAPAANMAGVAQAMKAQVLLPDLTDNLFADIASAALPEGADILTSTDGVTLINNAIELSVLTVLPGQQVTLTKSDGSAQTVTVKAQETAPGTAVALYRIKLQIQPDWASWTAVEGFKAGAPNREDRQLSFEELKTTLAAKVGEAKTKAMAAGAKAQTVSGVNSSVYADLDVPYDANLHYAFVIAQNTDAGTKRTGTGVFVTFGGGGEGGGGCGCDVSATAPAFVQMLPMLIAVLVPIGGIAVGRVRRRR
jgi:hypothetical protein